MPKSPKSKPGRKPGQTSPAIAAAARRNGEAGAEHGAKGGRPRDSLPAEVMERLGPPPSGPLDLARWNQRMLAEVAVLLMAGTIGHELADKLRALAATISKALPTDILVEVERLLRVDEKGQKAAATGTATEEVPNGEPDRSIRRSPR